MNTTANATNTTNTFTIKALSTEDTAEYRSWGKELGGRATAFRLGDNGGSTFVEYVQVSGNIYTFRCEPEGEEAKIQIEASTLEDALQKYPEESIEDTSPRRWRLSWRRV